jgi:hypothetical protein
MVSKASQLSLFSVVGKNVLITGGSRGIGFMIGKLLFSFRFYDVAVAVSYADVVVRPSMFFKVIVVAAVFSFLLLLLILLLLFMFLILLLFDGC